tara:strand:+ start:337 stop:504 length:168 start_codon:yes stop_codon:yes gene_type:complete
MTKKTLYIVDKQDGSIKPFVMRRTTYIDTNSDWVFFADKDVAEGYVQRKELAKEE